MKNILLLPLLLASNLLFGQVSRDTLKKVGTTPIYNFEDINVFAFNSGFKIDADGSPHAYHKDNRKALDYLANGGKPGNWWALVTDNGRKGNPIVQTDSDPAPGFYISMTSLQNKTKKFQNPGRYVDSESIPYIVLPPAFSTHFSLGDIALVINRKNNKRCFAIFADVGPRNKIGEGSIYLAKELGIHGSPKSGGATTGILYILIKKSGKKMVLSKEEIQVIGKSKLSEERIDSLIKLI